MNTKSCLLEILLESKNVKVAETIGGVPKGSSFVIIYGVVYGYTTLRVMVRADVIRAS